MTKPGVGTSGGSKDPFTIRFGAAVANATAPDPGRDHQRPDHPRPDSTSKRRHHCPLFESA